MIIIQAVNLSFLIRGQVVPCIMKYTIKIIDIVYVFGQLNFLKVLVGSNSSINVDNIYLYSTTSCVLNDYNKHVTQSL